jgi:hypothetical protein
MKRFWIGILSLTLALVPMASAQTAITKPVTKKTKAKAASTTADDIRALREMMQQQQQQIQQLQQAVQQRDAAVQQLQRQVQQTQSAATQAQQQAQQAESSSSEQKTTVEKLQSDMADVHTTLTNTGGQTQEEQKRVSGIEGTLARFQWGGDARVRYENFSSQDNPGCVGLGVGHCEDRQRARIRVRFGVTGKLSEDFIGGLAVATGAQTDPTTTNETLTNAFERKNFYLDRGFVTYNPVAHKWLSLTGGKWAYQWTRTSATFDPDISPEGFDEKFSFDFSNSFLKNVNFQMMQLMFNEVSKGPDSWASGGQIGAKFAIGSRWTMTPTYTLLNWYGENALLNTAFQGAGVPFAPNGQTNSSFTGGGCPVGNTCYTGGFLYSDLILNNSFKTWSERFPLYVIGEYEQNLDAGPSLLATGVGACFGKPCWTPQDKAYAVEIGMGQQKNQGDWQFGYEWRRQEADSVLSSFVESDQRAPTNTLQNRLYLNYKIRKNTQLMFSDWIGRTLNTNLVNAVNAEGITTGQQDPYLNRLQLDVVYTF